MGGQSTEDDVVCKAKLQDLQRFVAPEAIRYKYTWFAVSDAFGLGIEYTRKPLQADIRVIIPIFGESVVPARGQMDGPVTPVGRSWPDDERMH